MTPQQKGTIVSLSILGAIIGGIVIFVALWDYRVLVALCLLVLGCLSALVWLGLTVARNFNEMAIRQKRYHHAQEVPLDPAGYPTLLQPGEQPYYAAIQRHTGAVPHDERRHYE